MTATTFPAFPPRPSGWTRLRRVLLLDGRMRRRTFWTAQLGLNALAVVLSLFAPLLIDAPLDRSGRGLVVLSGATATLCAAASILLQVRRLHDLDLRGFWLLLPVPFGIVGALVRNWLPITILPLVATSLLALLMIFDGTPGTNRFGPDPKRRPDEPDHGGAIRTLAAGFDKPAAIAVTMGALLLALTPWRFGSAAALLPGGLAARIGDIAVAEAVPPSWRCPAPTTERVLTRLARRLAPDLQVRITYTTYPGVIGLTLPGGRIVVGEQAVRAADGPDQMAALLAHELAHVRLHHTERRTIAAIALALVPGALLRNAQIVTGGEARYSRSEETAADGEAARMLQRLGIAPRRLGELLGRLEARRPPRYDATPPRLSRWSASHPTTPERIARLDRYPAPANQVPPLTAGEWTIVRAGCEANIT